MKILLALVLAGVGYGQTKNYPINIVHLGAVDSTGATSTRPFAEVSSAPTGSCPLEGALVSVQNSAALYKCAAGTWSLITGSGESISVSPPLDRTGDVISCPTCVTTSVTILSQLASIGVITSGVWQATRVALPYGGTSSDLSATGPGFLKQATTGAAVTVAYPAYSELTGVPSTFAPSAHASSHQNGGADEIATATPGANAIPKAGAGGKFAAGWLQEVIALADLSDVSAKQGNGTLVATVCGSLIQGNALTTDSAGCLVDSGTTPGGGGSSAFSAITSATNTQAAMVVGSGASLAATGSGSIAATSLSALTGLPNIADQRILGNVSGGSTTPAALTAAQVAAMINGSVTIPIAQISSLKLSITDGTHLAYAGGYIRCGTTSVLTPAVTITLVAGTSGTVRIGPDCDSGGALKVAAGTLTISGSGFTDISPATDFSGVPSVTELASATVTSSAFASVTDSGRVLSSNDRPVAGDGVDVSINGDGRPEVKVNSSVARAASSTTVPGSCSSTSQFYIDTDAASGAKFNYCNGSTYEGVSGSGSAPAISRGVIASRPTCDATQALYYATDSNGLSSQCNGTSWADFFANVPITRPVAAASWTSVNSPTIADGGGFPNLSKGATGLGLGLVSVSDIAWTATATFIMTLTATTQECGIFATTGTTAGTHVASGITIRRSATEAPFLSSRVYNPINAACCTSAGLALDAPSIQPTAGGTITLRIARSGSNYTYYVCDGPGGTCTSMGSGAHNLGGTPTHVGFGCDPRGSTNLNMKLISWDVQ